MIRSPLSTLATVIAVAGALACSDSSPTGPPPVPSAIELVAVNSTGQTLSFFTLTDTLAPAAAALDLGASFDGVSADVSGDLAATSVSSFGGSRVLAVDLSRRSIRTILFPAPEADLANPGKATLEENGTIWVGGRASDAVYRIDPGAVEATRVASSVGTFVERILPVGAELFVVDANIDDDGLTFQPLGPARVVVLSRAGAPAALIALPTGSVNAQDAVLAGGRIVVLAAGSFDPTTFAPNDDGTLVLLDPGARAVVATLGLGANGLAVKAGEDGLVYVTTTSDFAMTSVLRVDPVGGRFVDGPATPLDLRDASGAAVNCWVATATSDGRLLCATFRTDRSGDLLLFSAGGAFLSSVPSGFGTTDIAFR
ncbi:MAG: hypothetical protein ACE5HF_05570 [Gemmatimonadota bacterium]